MLPNFLCIGTQRSGSTWLYKCLLEHPEVFVPKEVKEVSFFDVHYEKGISYYSSFFEDTEDFKAIGDVTPGYIYCNSCPSRIYQHLPDIKMIAVLRNPIERAHSAYTFFIKHKTGLTFDEALNSEDAVLKDNIQSIIELGIYHTQLERFFTHFKREQILILLYEDVLKNNARALKQIYGFLGVDTNFSPSWLDQTVNVNVYPKVQETLSKYHMEWAITAVKHTPFGTYLRKRYKKRRENAKETLQVETRNKLLDYYREPNIKLEKLIGMDLSGWN